MQLLIVSADKAKQIQEKAFLEHLRAIARAESLDHTRARFLTKSTEVDAVIRHFEEALINLEENDFDSYEIAREKADKIESIEREMDRAIAVWENALVRCTWEIAEAAKGLQRCSVTSLQTDLPFRIPTSDLRNS